MIEHVSETAQAIKEIGITEMILAAFLVVFMSLLGYFVIDLRKSIKELLAETRKQNDMLNDIAEEIRPQLKERIKVIANAFFDLAVFRALAFIKRTKKENHINEHKDRTIKKIHQWVTNLHSDRNTKFDNFKVHGKMASEYTNPQWIEKVAEAIEKEVYDPEPNEDRSYTNLKTVYDDIKIDYYKRMN